MGSNTTPSTHSPGPDDRPKHNPPPTSLGATAANNSSVQLLNPFWNNRCGSASRSDYPDSGHWSHIMSRTTSMAATYKTALRRGSLQNTFTSYYRHLPSTCNHQVQLHSRIVEEETMVSTHIRGLRACIIQPSSSR